MIFFESYNKYCQKFLFMFLLAFAFFIVSIINGLNAIAQDEQPTAVAKKNQQSTKAKKSKAKTPAKPVEKQSAKTKTAVSKEKAITDAKKIPTAKINEVKLAENEFYFYHNGRQFGKETYERKISSDLINIKSEIIISVAANIKIKQNYELDPKTMILKKYSSETLSPGSTLSVSIKSDNLYYKLTASRNGKTFIDRQFKTNAVYVLDNTCANNFQCLLDAYSQKKAGSQKFNCIVPQTLATGEVTVTKIGFVKGYLNKTPCEFLKYKITNSINKAEVSAYSKNDGRLACIQIPASKTEFSISNILISEPAPAPAPVKTDSGTESVKINKAKTK